jgi:hypothetical protein
VDGPEETKDGRASARPPESASRQRIEKNTRGHRLRKRLFGTRLRIILTGMITLVVAPAIAGLIVALVLHVWSVSPKTESESPTQVIFYEPWDTVDISKITLSNVHIDHIIKGYCWESSIVTERSDAYRCMYAPNDDIIDPCFAYPFLPSSEVSEVACPFPDPDSITILRLTKPLPPIGVRKAIFPTEYWFIVLADGMKCYAGGGTVGTIGGEVSGTYYYCPGYGFPIYGYPDSSSSIWTILEQKKGASGLEPVPIATAYR